MRQTKERKEEEGHKFRIQGRERDFARQGNQRTRQEKRGRGFTDIFSPLLTHEPAIDKECTFSDATTGS